MRAWLRPKEIKMDQTVTGQFIKTVRKEKGLTQRELSERLNISEKTVSKWETGKGLPDVGLMLPLSKVLGITVNELLSGQRLNEKAYVEKAEENLAALTADKCSGKTKIVVSLISFALTLISCLGLIVIAAGYADVEVWLRIFLIAMAFLSLFASIASMIILWAGSEVYECPECGTKFAPTLAAYIFSPHTMTKRRLKCPHCGKKSWCKSFWRK